jgi:methyl-accepting chemotaxis protein
MTKKKQITTNELAIIVKKGFKQIEENTDEKIENLARITKRGFEEVDKRFEEVNKRFEEVDKRFEEVDKRFEILEEKVDNLEATITTQLPDKEFLTDKLGELAVELTIRMREDRDRVKRFSLLISTILRRSKLPTKKEKEALCILEKEFSMA